MAGDPSTRDPETAETGKPATRPDNAAGGATGNTSSAAEGGPARRTAWGSWVVLCLLFLFAGAQAAGVIFRDRVDGRKPTLAQAPAEAGESSHSQPQQKPTPASRFGPGVTEVVVVAPPGASASPPQSRPAPEAAPVVAKEPAAAAQPAELPAPPKVEAPPQPAPPPPATAEIPPAIPAQDEKSPPSAPSARTRTEAAQSLGDYVLQLGVFRSQRYRREEERRLDRLGVPHLRVEFAREDERYRLAIPARDEADRAKARRIIESAGYSFWETADGIEVHFYLESEAQRALDFVAKQGLQGGYGRTRGSAPVWTVYAGPYPLEEAREVQERLARAGVKTLLKKQP